MKTLRTVFLESTQESIIPGTRVLIVRNRKLVPGEITKTHNRGQDWYWIKTHDGAADELLKLADKAKPGKTFELVAH